MSGLVADVELILCNGYSSVNVIHTSLILSSYVLHLRTISGIWSS